METDDRLARMLGLVTQALGGPPMRADDAAMDTKDCLVALRHNVRVLMVERKIDQLEDIRRNGT